MTGRNVTFKELMATAYDQSQPRVALPWDAPKGNFDFLVTVSDKQREHLQAAIRKKLGYVAQMETRDADVLALKVENTNLPGLTLSGADQRENVNYNNGKLYFTHLRLG